MGRRRLAGSINWITCICLVILVCSTSTEAQTAIGFQFKQNFSLIVNDIDNFTRLLQEDVRNVFNFVNTTEVSSTQVTNSTHGKIQVNFTLSINTTLRSKIQLRTQLEHNLRGGTYEFVFEGNMYEVDASTVWIVNSFDDVWHQYAPEIAIAVICGLAALAIFVATIQLICINRKHQRQAMYAAPPPVSNRDGNGRTHNSLGQTNGGFVIEEINGGHRVHTPTSSIGSSRFHHDRDTFYDKLIYGNYEIPARHMYNYL